METTQVIKLMDKWPSFGIETLTNYETANEIISNIDETYFKNPDTKFLDPCCGKGTFIIKLYEKLLTHHSKEHIINNMLYGMDIEHTQVMNTVFFLEKISGIKSKNIKRGNNLKKDWKENFNVIIMNPPYQNSIKDKGGSDQQIYHKFVLKAIEMEPEIICAITPSRWFIAENMSDYRKELLKDNKIKKIVDYPNSKECFKNVSIEGGISYIIWDKDYNGICEFDTVSNVFSNKTKRDLKQFDIIVRDSNAIKILNKVYNKNLKTFDSIVSSRNPFGFETNFYKNTTTSETPLSEHTKIYTNAKNPDLWIKTSEIEKNLELKDKYKVLISKAYGGTYKGNGPARIINNPFVALPNEICSDSFIICGTFNTKQEAENCVTYMNTKFFKFMVSLIKTTQDNSKNVFKFVPLPDFTRSYEDKFIYKLYGISEDEISYIEEIVK